MDREEIMKPDKFYFTEKPTLVPMKAGQSAMIYYSCYVDLKQALTNTTNKITQLESERDKYKADAEKIIVCCSECDIYSSEILKDNQHYECGCGEFAPVISNDDIVKELNKLKAEQLLSGDVNDRLKALGVTNIHIDPVLSDNKEI